MVNSWGYFGHKNIPQDLSRTLLITLPLHLITVMEQTQFVTDLKYEI